MEQNERVAIGPGAAMGIGNAIAARLAQNGPSLVLADVDRKAAVSDDAAHIIGQTLAVDGGMAIAGVLQIS